MVLHWHGNSAPTRQIRGEKGVKQEDDVAFSAETKKRPEPLRDTTTAGTEPKHTQLNSTLSAAQLPRSSGCRVAWRGVAPCHAHAFRQESIKSGRSHKATERSRRPLRCERGSKDAEGGAAHGETTLPSIAPRPTQQWSRSPSPP